MVQRIEKKKCGILIVDDSRIFRSALEKSLEGMPDIEVIGSVFSGEKAVEFISDRRPDVVTLDVEMPGMNGLAVLDAIRKINEASPEMQPVGVIMISIFTGAGTEATIKALEAGAFDFVTKPRAGDADEGIQKIRTQLLTKIRQFMAGNTPLSPSPLIVKPSPAFLSSRARQRGSSAIRAVLIGSSTGGPKALNTLLPALCEKTDVPILVAQHMPPVFTASLAKSLDKKCSHRVKEGTHLEPVRRGCIYIAPGGRHMLLRSDENRTVLAVSDSPPEDGYRPSVDILFRSGAAALGGSVLAVVLTGMGADGAKGVVSLKRAGARIIAQDKDSSIVWGMPKCAWETGCVDDVVSLSGIPDAVESHLNGK